MFKKVIAILLALGMTVSMLAGCGKTEESAADAKTEEVKVEESAKEDNATVEEEQGVVFPLEEPITFTVVACTNNEYTLEDSVAFQKMEEMTNVHWEFINIPVAEREEKLNVLINSGDYPDIFMKCNTDNKMYDSGIFLPLEELLPQYAPNYTALMDGIEGAWARTTHPDGHVYGLARIYPDTYMNPDLWINDTWLKNLGLKKPTSWDELYDVLKAFKEQDPNRNGKADEIPFLMCSDWDKIWDVFNYMGVVRQSNSTDPWVLSETGDETYYWPTSEKGKEMFEILAKWYADGLLYNDAFVASYEQIVALGQSAPIVGMQLSWGANELVGYSSAGGYSDDFDFLEPFGGNKLPVSSGIEPWQAFAITDACEYPEIALAWIDYFYTEEGCRLAEMGEEGIHYEIMDDGTYRKITDGDFDPNSVGIFQGGGVSLPMYYSDFLVYSKYADPEDLTAVRKVDAFKRVSDNYTSDKVYPKLIFTTEENETIATISADCTAYWKQYASQVITGELELESTWDEYIAKMNEMGLEELIEIYNEALDRAL